MRYRKLDANGDMVFGHGAADYHHDTPEAVAQAVLTRLRLARGEWFLDVAEGTPYSPAILGRHTAESYDPAIRARVLETEGVRSILEYSSSVEGESRRLAVSVRIDTIYGPADVQEIM